jgi:arylsulfatase A-like enzyme
MQLGQSIRAAALAALGTAAYATADQAQIPLAGPATGLASTKPNIIFILTDDQDLQLNSLSYMPLVKKHLIEQGTFYKRHFCTSAVCCPSRASLWTGKLAHNTNVTDLFPPYGTPAGSNPEAPNININH